MQPTWLLALLICLLAIAGCRDEKRSASFQTPEETDVQRHYETDQAKLQKLIQLGAAPSSVRWQTFEKGANHDGLGPRDWGLIAVLEYDEATMQRIRGQVTAKQIDQDLQVGADLAQSWFPDEIRSSFISVPDSNNLMLNKPRYEPTLFMKPPLQHGYCFISGNWLFLYLQTM